MIVWYKMSDSIDSDMAEMAKRCQSIAEYVLIISIVISAVLGMKVYLTRALQARVKDLTDTLIDSHQVSEVNPAVPLMGDVNLSGGQKAAQKSSSTASANVRRTENASSISVVKTSYFNTQSKYEILNDPDKKY